MLTDVVLTVLAALLCAAAVMVLAALAAQAEGRVAVVDVAWGAGFAVIAVVTGLVGRAVADGDAGVHALVVALVAVWGARLAWHVRGRAVGGGEDPRYERLLGGSLAEVGMGLAVRKVFVVQGVAMFVVSLPIAVGAPLPIVHPVALVAGIALWLVGFVFETVGDAQLTRYKATPREERPPVMDRGLWRFTRHPNYFGDACVWWGLWLAAGLASGWWAGLATVLAPIAMTYFLAYATGARLLEQEMMKRPGYPEYAARTSMFLPLPPKRR